MSAPSSPQSHTIVFVGASASGKSILSMHLSDKYDIGVCREIETLKYVKKGKHGIIIEIQSYGFNTSKSQLPSDAIIVQITRENFTSLNDLIADINVHHTLANNGTKSEFLASGLQLFEKISQ
jgi:guanylate kinase